MGLFHHITVFFISEQEKRDFLEAGVEFKEVTRGPRGECAIFEIGEDDTRWERVAALVASLEGNDRVPKKLRVQDLSMTAPMDELMRRLEERTAAFKRSQPGPKWLDGYSGQSADQLLSLEGEYRIDSLVLAFEQAIGQKGKRGGVRSLTDEERVVLAVEALEREVNNGGYDQFFVNSSREFAPTVVAALQRIGCKKTAAITQRAITALGISDLTSEAIEAAMVGDDEQRLAKLNRCDDSYYKCAEPVAERLFAFIKVNKAGIKF
jgi:hypothetical protein